jgi:hypothetical protein
MSARAHEHLALGAFLCAVFGVFSVLHGNYGTPLHAITPEQYARFLSLNLDPAIGVGCTADRGVLRPWVASTER